MMFPLSVHLLHVRAQQRGLLRRQLRVRKEYAADEAGKE